MTVLVMGCNPFAPVKVVRKPVWREEERAEAVAWLEARGYVVTELVEVRR